VELPQSVRENLVEELDEYLEAVSTPEAEAVVRYLIELLETAADELGIDDIVLTLEEDAALDDSLALTLEDEMESNAEFTYTGEEIASLLERICDIEWGDDDDDDDDDFDDDDDDDFEL
jgi:vacuolar-type H+-ATPase subunit E/Vma4